MVMTLDSRRGDLLPLEPPRALAGQVFVGLTFHNVDDGHRLYRTVQGIGRRCWATDVRHLRCVLTRALCFE